MTYEEFEAQISAYIDGELSSVEKAAMDQKATECDKCRDLLKEVQALTDRLAVLPQAQPSAEFQFTLRSHLLMDVANEQRTMLRVHRVFFGSATRKITSLAAAVLLGLGLASMVPELSDAPPVVTETAVYDGDFDLVPGQTASNHQGALERLSQQSLSLNSRLYRDANNNVVRLDTIQAYPPRETPWLKDQQDVKRIPASFSF